MRSFYTSITYFICSSLIYLTATNGVAQESTGENTMVVDEHAVAQEVYVPRMSVQQIDSMMKNIQLDSNVRDDIMLQMLLKTPEEKRQYLFPQLHDNIGMRKKIVSHPQIALWKGKTPTKLPKQLESFAKEHLKYLPSNYYHLLDPDLWEHNVKEADETSALIQTTQRMKLTPHIGEFYAFPKLISYYSIDKKKAANYMATNLTKADITLLFITVKKLQDYLDKNQDVFDSLRRQLNHEPSLNPALINPFQSLVERMKKAISEKETEKLFKSFGWKSADEFAKKSDRILKAYRVNTMTLPMAIQFHKARVAEKAKKISFIAEDVLAMAKMYEAEPGDVYFVEPFSDEIRKNLKPEYLLLIQTPIYME